MKLKYLVFSSIVLIFLFAIPFSCSAEFDVADCKFEIPDGYSVNMTSDVSTTLIRNNNTEYSIFIIADNSTSDAVKYSRQGAGFQFLSEDNYTSENGISLNQQNYFKNESYYSFYSFEVNGTSFLLGYTFPVEDDFVENENNPAEEIINSI